MTVGIDLGTTYSAVATLDGYGRPVIVRNGDGESLTPSAVYIGDNGQTLVGAEAKELLESGDMNVAIDFKRFMGDPDFAFFAAGRDYTATDLSALLLGKLRQDAEQTLGEPVTDAVITVPAYFGEEERQATLEAGRQAGLNVLRIINEPTAAAITFGLNRDEDQKILVYDLGGGTFDVTILDISERAIRVVATGGDHRLGGRDWDDAILNWLTQQFYEEFGDDLYQSPETINDLTYQCEQLKKQLTQKESASVIVRYNGQRGKYELTRAGFETMTEHLMMATTAKTEEVLETAGLTWADLSGALLVGGSTRMPMIAQWVKQMSGKEPIRGVDVDQAVALGAAIQAGIEMERRGAQLGGPAAPTGTDAAPRFAFRKRIEDVMSHSLGAVAQSADGQRYVNSIIIRRNTTIPCTEHRPFRYRMHGRGSQLEVYTVQGEVPELEMCRVTGKYVVDGMTDNGQGEAIVDIAYAYDENGTTVVTATQKDNGRQLSVRQVALDSDMSWLYVRPKGRGADTSIIIAVDLSGSMGGTPIRKAREAAQKFLSQIDLSSSRVGIMGFANRHHMFVELSDDAAAVGRAIDKLEVGGAGVGGGNLSNPLGQALNLFNAEMQHRQTKAILIVLTDGCWVNPNRAIKTSDKMRELGHDVIAIGFGGADEKFLRRISTRSEAALMTDLSQLVESFSNIAQEINQSGGISQMTW